MKPDELPEPRGTEPNELKQPWQQPVIEYLNLASSQADGGATFDGTTGSS
jgi:hypothetical protein